MVGWISVATRCFIVDGARGLFVGVELERVLYWGWHINLVGDHVLWGPRGSRYEGDY